MKNAFSAGRLYSAGFIVLILGGLFSFAVVPGMSLSGLSTEFRERDRLIGWNTSLRMLLGDRDFGNNVVGKEGWIYWMDPGMTADYQRTDLFTPDALQALGNALEDLNRRLQDRGITLLVVIPPDKSTIYPQNMPDQIPVLGQVSRLDQFIAYMDKNGRTRILDLRPVLKEASRKDQVYFRTDSHWNSLGAYLGYVEIMKPLEKKDPRLSPLSLSDFKIVDAGMRLRDLPRMMKLNGLKEETYVLRPRVTAPAVTGPPSPDPQGITRIENTDASLPALLVYHDSFYESLGPFLEPHFGRVVTVPFSPGSNVWSLKWINKESPDIVIIEIVERNLQTLGYLLSGHNP